MTLPSIDRGYVCSRSSRIHKLDRGVEKPTVRKALTAATTNVPARDRPLTPAPGADVGAAPRGRPPLIKLSSPRRRAATGGRPYIRARGPG